MKHIVQTGLIALAISTAAFAQSMDHDAMFADAMTKHHQDGIRMAQMAVDKAESAELRSMARKMIDDQRADIERMQALRGDAPKTSMSMMMDMPGMMPEPQMQRDMARLQAASGHEFDLAFTEIMAAHHEGALAMSRHELEMGKNAGMKEMAQKILDKQTTERQKLIAMHDDMSHMPMTSSSRERLSKD